MSEERLKILKMMDQGKISVEEANELLATLEATDKQHVEVGNKAGETSNTPGSLKIIVDENGENKVNISLPLALAKSMLRIIPQKARVSLEENDIDLEQLISSVKEGTADGNLVDINDGSEHVVIRVE